MPRRARPLSESPLTERQAEALAAAPIGLEEIETNGDPHAPPRYRYQGANGHVASGLWTRQFLQVRGVGPDHGAGLLLVRTPKGERALELHRIRMKATS